MAEQVVEWEEKIRKLVLRDDEDGKISEESDDDDWDTVEETDLDALPLSPTIRLVNWTDFKNKYLTQTEEHAIDVLLGEAKAYPQQNKNEKQNFDEGGNSNISPGNLTGKTPPSSGTRSSQGDVPYQIRINSKPLLQIFAEIESSSWDLDPIIMSRPYQFLSYYELDIKKILGRLEAKWANTEMDQQVPTSPSKKNSNVSLVAMGEDKPAAPAGAGHCETHAKDKGVSENDVVVLESSEKATPTNEVESVKRRHRGKLRRKYKAKPSPIELVDSVEALRAVRCLMQFIKTYLTPYWSLFDPARCHKIQFVDLWHIFKPGDKVYVPLGAEIDAEALNNRENQQNTDSRSLLPSKERYQKVWKVYYVDNGVPYQSSEELELRYGHTKPKPMPLLLRCYYLDFDGERVGAVMRDFRINVFQGEKNINSLPVYPMKFAKNGAKIEDQMRKRGQMFREFETFQHRYCIGASLVHEPSGVPIFNSDDQPMHPQNISSQVIVDFRRVLQENPQWYPKFDNGKVSTREYQLDTLPLKVWKDKERRTLDREVEDFILVQRVLNMKLAFDLKDREPFLKDDYDESPTTLADLRDDDLILLPARVFAYSFRNRKFGMLSDQRPSACRAFTYV